MIQQFTAALRVMRPRSVANTQKAVQHLRTDLNEVRDHVKDLRRGLKSIEEKQSERICSLAGSIQALAREQKERFEALHRELQGMGREVAELRVREAQLRAIVRKDVELETEARHLEAIISDRATPAHISEAVSKACLRLHPFPHAIVDRVLPDALYNALITGLPPVELFADKIVNKQQLTVPLKLGHAYGRRVWRFMAQSVVPEMIMPAALALFRDVIAEWVRGNFPEAGRDVIDRLALRSSDGRVMLRRRGYYIPPHRDPKWGFLTGLMYLARPGDDERWGTQLCAVDNDEEAVGALPHWIDEQRCRVVEHVAFRRNRLLIFLNSVGAHTANIPADAEPASLERYLYQFRIGPDAESIAALLASLPPERRPFWDGKLTDY